MDKTDSLMIAQSAWGNALPNYVRVLAERCNVIGQRRAAGAIKYSASVVNQVLRNKYKGDMGKMENAIKGGLLAATVHCPGCHDAAIPLHECLSNQKMKPITASPLQARIYRACRSGCPHSKIGRVE